MHIAGGKRLAYSTSGDIGASPEALRAFCVGEIFAYLSRRIPRREDAEDLALEVFVAAYESRRKAPAAEMRAWLFGIARRKLADYLRKRARRPENLESDTGGLPDRHHHDGPDKSYLQREAIELLRSIVENLAPEQKEALLMQHLEQLSIFEISLAMDKSPAAVNSLLQRARATVYNRGKSYFLEPHEVSR